MFDVEMPSDGVFLVKDKPYGTAVYFYEKSETWRCEDCPPGICAHIRRAKSFKEGGPVKKITAPKAVRSLSRSLLNDDDAISNSNFSTRV